MEQVNNILTIDRDATREAIRIKFRSPVDFALASGFRQSTIYGILNGSIRYCKDPDSVYQAILRAMREHGVLTEESELKEAA